MSAQTIRRDIIRLDERGVLQRFHGGAGATDTAVIRLGYAEKRELAVEGKRAIAETAAGLVPHGASVFLDVGTTAEAVARALGGHTALRVFTNSLAAAGQLAGRDGLEVVVTGARCAATTARSSATASRRTGAALVVDPSEHHRIVATFTQAHHDRLGFATPDRPLVVGAIAVEATAPGEAIGETPSASAGGSAVPPINTATLWSGAREHRAPVYARARL